MSSSFAKSMERKFIKSYFLRHHLSAGAVAQQDGAIGNAMGHIENSNRGWNYMGEAQR